VSNHVLLGSGELIEQECDLATIPPVLWGTIAQFHLGPPWSWAGGLEFPQETHGNWPQVGALQKRKTIRFPRMPLQIKLVAFLH
jgi:hypothetical protein